MDAKEIKISSSAKVLSILNQLITNKAQAIVWQNEGAQIERKSTKASLVKFSSDFTKIYLTPSKKFNFQTHQEIFFLNKNKSILFKTNIYNNSPFKLILNSPKTLMIRDARRDPRQNLEHKDVNMSFHYGAKTGSIHERFPYTSKVLDFSYGGLSFKSNLTSVKQFMRGDKITLKLNNQANDIIEAKVCYVTRSLNMQSNQSYFRVGVSFS